MEEIIVRVARAIASLPRLRLLSRLARDDELIPTALAEELRMPLNLVSMHLRTLATAGLVRGRKSGARCYYSVQSPYSDDTLSGKLTAWLRSVLQSPKQSISNLGLQEVRDDSLHPESLLHKTIFEAITAFTDLRRLHILRRLGNKGGATVEKLVNELSMSHQAASRHLNKLKRRGYVQTAKPKGSTPKYELSPRSKTAVHAQIFGIVRWTWKVKESRTS